LDVITPVIPAIENLRFPYPEIGNTLMGTILDNVYYP